MDRRKIIGVVIAGGILAWLMSQRGKSRKPAIEQIDTSDFPRLRFEEIDTSLFPRKRDPLTNPNAPIEPPRIEPEVTYSTTEYFGTWRTPEEGLRFEDAFREADEKYNLPRGMTSRVAFQESSYRTDVESPAGAQGIMQIIPRFHPGVNPLDPWQAIDYGASYLRRNYDRFGTWEKALAAYNWGPGNLSEAIEAHGPLWLNYAPHETKNYVTQIGRDVGIFA